MNKAAVLLVSILFLSLITAKAFAEESSKSRITSIQNKEQEMRESAVKSAKEDIARQSVNKPRQSYSNFTCAGIGMIDNGIALDGSAVFFKADTRELICTFGMVYCFSADAKNCSQPCPPPEWKENGCWDKRKQLLEKEDKEWKEYMKKVYEKK